MGTIHPWPLPVMAESGRTLFIFLCVHAFPSMQIPHSIHSAIILPQYLSQE